MKKSVCQIFNKNCLETGLKPNIPTINAAALEYVKRFPLFNVPAVAFSDLPSLSDREGSAAG